MSRKKRQSSSSTWRRSHNLVDIAYEAETVSAAVALERVDCPRYELSFVGRQQTHQYVFWTLRMSVMYRENTLVTSA